MGGSSSTTIDNINNSITDNILNSIQTVQQNSSVNQLLSGKCPPNIVEIISKEYNKCIFDIVLEKDYDQSKNIPDLCNSLTSICKMNEIDMKQVVNISDITTNSQDIQSEVEKTISNSLNQYNNAGTKEDIQNAVNAVNKSIADIINNLSTNSDNIQTIELNGVRANIVSIGNTENIIRSQISSLSDIQTSVTNISNIITQTSDNSSEILSTSVYIIGIIILSGILISLTMVMKRSNDVSDFFFRISPYLIFILLSSIIIIVHLLSKPSYVYFTDVNGKIVLNKVKFAEYITLYLLILAIIIYSVYRIYTKTKKNS